MTLLTLPYGGQYRYIREGMGRRRRAQERPGREIYRWSQGDLDCVNKIAHPENLLLVYDLLAASGGAAPGRDGFSYRDLTRSMVADAFRKVSDAVLEYRYVPPPPRLKQVPKRPRGYRRLSLSNIIHRVLDKAAALAIDSACESLLPDTVHGFRPGRSLWTLLPHLNQLVHSGHRYISSVDVRDAFPTTPIAGALAGLARAIDDTDVLSFAEMLMRGHRGALCDRGLAQGAPTSVPAFNAAMFIALDEPLSAVANAAFLRYADNLIVVSRTASDGLQALGLTRRRLSDIGMTLKSNTDDICDLQQTETEILGIRARYEDTALRLAVGETAWDDLACSIRDCHRLENPTRTARETALGWTSAYGPAIEIASEPDAISRIRTMLAIHGFLEGPSSQLLQAAMCAARRRWSDLAASTTVHHPDASTDVYSAWCSATGTPPAPDTG
jgi:hypothetical protein